MRKPRLVFSEKLPPPAKLALRGCLAETLLIYDSALARAVPSFEEWTVGFGARYEVRAGEALKELDAFPTHLRTILERTRHFAPPRMTIVVAGGGSVGDFGGFVASILKRGVRLVHLPSTWLSAIDSSHGGKTALNAAGVKNQVGTFYPASEVHLVRALLKGQGEERRRDAEGELAKIALIDGRPWVRKLEAFRGSDESRLWTFLKPAIESKYRVVARDPLETKDIRKILNLGHTLGHVLEAHHGLAHGRAVALGLHFAAHLSRKRGLLRGKEADRVQRLLVENFGINAAPGGSDAGLDPVPEADFFRLLSGDKKRASLSEVGFVLLAGFGRARLVNVPMRELMDEARAQGWMT